MIILRLLLLLTNLHLKLLSTQGTGADKLLSTQRVKNYFLYVIFIKDDLSSVFAYHTTRRASMSQYFDNLIWDTFL